MLTKALKNFLKDIFCGIGQNSPYHIGDFVNVLLDAVEHVDFVNNTCERIKGPTGETVFARLNGVDSQTISSSFYEILKEVFTVLRKFLRNRKVALAFDTTDEPFYGKVGGLWIHPYGPVRGSTGCFKFITVSCIDRWQKFILGSLPVRIGADIVGLVEELLNQAKKFVSIEIALFDRGFDDYKLIDMLQRKGIRYQILWRKYAWTTKKFKKMKIGELREVTRTGKFSRDKSTFKFKVRFVLIKRYRRFKNADAFDWVFITNTRQKSQHYYVDKYRKRWNIETVFRVLDNIQIKTTTKNEIIRYFLNMFCCLIYNLWKLHRIVDSKISLKNFVVKQLKEFLQEIRKKAHIT